MWNPKGYRDTDFGLAKGESFEPDEAEIEEQGPGPSVPYIQTVLGPIELSEAGVTLVREHLYANPPTEGPDWHLTSQDAALIDLETFFTVGGRTIVDTTTLAQGRSAPALEWLAQRAPVHIVASTGIDLGPDTDISWVRSSLARDVSMGLDGSSILPGMMVVRVDGRVDRFQIRAIFAMIAEMIDSAPLPIMIDLPTEDLDAGLLAEVIDAGILPDRIIAANLGQNQDELSVKAIAELGTFLLFDDLGTHRNEPDRAIAARVASLLGDGCQDRILLSHGFARRSHLIGYEGGPGLGYIVEQFAIMLMEAGVAAQEVRTMLLENSASALTIVPPEPLTAT